MIHLLIYFYDKGKNRVFKFMTNDEKMSAAENALIYKQRRQIEILFKRLKQNL
jgi:IS4 transposase